MSYSLTYGEDSCIFDGGQKPDLALVSTARAEIYRCDRGRDRGHHRGITQEATQFLISVDSPEFHCEANDVLDLCNEVGLKTAA